MNIKIGDFVKLKEWEEFLSVSDISGDYLETEQEFNGQVYKTWYNISLGFIKQGEDMIEKQEDQKQDEFQVGDVVWDVIHGRGEVTNLNTGPFPVRVYCACIDDYNYYTLDGKLDSDGPRTLFFSEPKIEGAVKRPFVPTLVGKRVVIEVEAHAEIANVFKEDAERIYTSTEGHYWTKNGITAIYEVSSENLLKK